MTPFCFEHVFRASSIAPIFAAYFDPTHQVDQDRALEIIEREVIELDAREDAIHRVSRVVPRRQLPSVLRPFASGPLQYVERVVWKRSENVIAIDLRPSLFRARMDARYRLDQIAPGSVRRRYEGEVSVDVALVANRIERSIVAEFERSIAIAATCTQNHLDQQSIRSVAARA